MADGSSKYQFLVSYINGDLRNVLAMADAKARWLTQVVTTLAELALRCTHLTEEVRPGFAEVVNTLRPLRDMPDSQPDGVAPPVSKTHGRGKSSRRKASTPPITRGGGAVQHQTVAASALQGSSQQQQTYLPMYSNTGSMDAKGGQMILGQGPMPGQLQHMPRDSPICMQHEPSSSCFAQQQQWSIQHHVAPSPSPVQMVQQVQTPQRMAAQPTTPILWSLECVIADGLDSFTREQSVLVHRQEPGGPLLSTHRVGRLFQEEFFNTILTSEASVRAVSREHFQIWAEEMPTMGPDPPGAANTIPCIFFLTNFSINGCLVNGVHLHAKGEQMLLHVGDMIALAGAVQSREGVVLKPFLEFRFSLEGSALRDSDAVLDDGLLQAGHSDVNGYLRGATSFMSSSMNRQPAASGDSFGLM